MSVKHFQPYLKSNIYMLSSVLLVYGKAVLNHIAHLLLNICLFEVYLLMNTVNQNINFSKPLAIWTLLLLIPFWWYYSHSHFKWVVPGASLSSLVAFNRFSPLLALFLIFFTMLQRDFKINISIKWRREITL